MGDDSVSSVADGDGRFLFIRCVCAREDRTHPRVQCPPSVLFGMVTVELRVSH